MDLHISNEVIAFLVIGLLAVTLLMGYMDRIDKREADARVAK